MKETEVSLHQGDCLEVMQKLERDSVNLVFADLPYGVTQCRWDTPIDLAQFWQQVYSIVKASHMVALTATQPFATTLITSNAENFSYDIIWKKSRCTGFFNAKRAPLRGHEHVLMFGKKPQYYPQMAVGKKLCLTSAKNESEIFGTHEKRNVKAYTGEKRYPKSVVEVAEPDLRVDTLNGRKKSKFHPTQKPVALLEWLIKTYTKDGDTIFDPVAGSGSIAIAAMNVGRRKVICIEKDPTYFSVMSKRVADHKEKLRVK